MLDKNHEFNKGAEFWLGRYYDTSNLCLSNNSYYEKFGEYIVAIFKDDSIKNELCSLIGESFTDNFKSFKDNGTILNENCFEKGEVFYDKKFKYIRLPNFNSEDLKNFELRISINPCLTNNCAMTKIYCNSLLHEKINKHDSIDFYRRSRVLCETVLSYITKIYAYYFVEFVTNRNPLHSNKINTKYFDENFSLISTFLGSDDNEIKESINKIKSTTIPLNKKRSDVKLFASIIRETNKIINNNFLLKDYKWSYINAFDKNKEITSAIIGYAESENTGHLVGISNNIPRKILLPMHVKFINEN